jgi:hypothetical protein
MKIYYISLGSFCYPKIVIRETGREYGESLPFDFNSSPHLTGITSILKDVYEKIVYEIELKEILQIYNEDELSVSEKNMYLVHFFKTCDLLKPIKGDSHVNANEYIKPEKIEDVKDKFKKRFYRLYEILNDPSNILCFMRIENYDNYGWENELKEFTYILSLFKNPNKYLIYAQNLIHDNLDYRQTNVLNYEYYIPILFCKHYFYDKEMIEKKHLFVEILEYFENIMNNSNVIMIKDKNNLIEKYYLDKTTYTIFKMSNIKYFSKFYIMNDDLYINSVVNGYEKYVKCHLIDSTYIYLSV